MGTQMQGPMLVFDFGGTKLAAAVVDSTTGEIYAHIRQPTPVKEGAQASLQAIVKAGKEVLTQSGIEERAVPAVGISFGGPVSDDRRTVIRSLHVKAWEAVDLPAQLTRIFNKPAFMDNDGNAAALGEWRFGKGNQAENMLYIQVSTGVGAGLIIAGRVYRGSGLAGEFGHLTVLSEGPECVCGKAGCIESISSGWAIARDGRSALLENPDESLLRRMCKDDPERVTARLVLEAYRRGDRLVQPIVERAFTCLAIGIANAVILLDPQTIVIGGGVARAQDVMQPLLEAALRRYLPSMVLRKSRYRLEFSMLDGSETLLGAALLPSGF